MVFNLLNNNKKGRQYLDSSIHHSSRVVVVMRPKTSNHSGRSPAFDDDEDDEDLAQSWRSYSSDNNNAARGPAESREDQCTREPASPRASPPTPPRRQHSIQDDCIIPTSPRGSEEGQLRRGLFTGSIRSLRK